MSETACSRPGSISVVIPAYNHAQYIGRTLESLISQTRQAAEIIVVDDGSSDNTEHVLRSYTSSISYLRQENRGMGQALERGIRAAGADYIWMLASDDLLDRDALQVLGREMDFHPESGMVHGRAVVVGADDEPIKGEPVQGLGARKSGRYTPGDLIRKNTVPAVSVLCRRAALLQILPFMAFPLCLDWAIWMEIALLGWEVRAVPQELGLYRRHGGNTSAAEREMEFRREELELLGSMRVRYGKQGALAREFDRAIASRLSWLGWLCLDDGAVDEARQHFRTSISRGGYGVDNGLGLIASCGSKRLSSSAFALRLMYRDLRFLPASLRDSRRRLCAATLLRPGVTTS
jgi:glycosyltransferase involved in cell wall biosynthesis